MINEIVNRITTIDSDYYIVDDTYAFYWERDNDDIVYVEICNHGDDCWDRVVGRDDLTPSEITFNLIDEMIDEVNVLLAKGGNDQ